MNNQFEALYAPNLPPSPAHRYVKRVQDDQIVESKEITPISSPKNTYDTNSDELNDTDEEEVHIDVKYVIPVVVFKGLRTNKLAICDNCGVGAEHNDIIMFVTITAISKRINQKLNSSPAKEIKSSTDKLK
ncbi:hypothetical protein YC2023_073005 [Brassica napus]